MAHNLQEMIDESLARNLYLQSDTLAEAGYEQGTTSHTETITQSDVAKLIDHTLLKPESTKEQIQTLCAEAVKFSFATVCVNPTWVALCRRITAGSPVGVATVIGFPLGATLPESKAFESRIALESGASEVDMVLNVGRLKSGDVHYVHDDIAKVVEEAGRHHAIVKVIIETGLLSNREKIVACVLAKAAGADFVKTSTGFSSGGATVEDVVLMRRTVGEKMGVKASGGVRSLETVRRMVAAGATRIGTSSGLDIMGSFMHERGYVALAIV